MTPVKWVSCWRAERRALSSKTAAFLNSAVIFSIGRNFKSSGFPLLSNRPSEVEGHRGNDVLGMVETVRTTPWSVWRAMRGRSSESQTNPSKSPGIETSSLASWVCVIRRSGWSYPFGYPIRNLVSVAVYPPRRSVPTGGRGFGLVWSVGAGISGVYGTQQTQLTTSSKSLCSVLSVGSFSASPLISTWGESKSCPGFGTEAGALCTAPASSWAAAGQVVQSAGRAHLVLCCEFLRGEVA
jgi:hypothetical protein